MAKVKVEVLDAVVDGKGKGEQIEIDEKSAANLAALKYVKVIEKKAQPKAEAKPKGSPKKKISKEISKDK